MKNINELLGKN